MKQSSGDKENFEPLIYRQKVGQLHLLRQKTEEEGRERCQCEGLEFKKKEVNENKNIKM